MGRISQSAVKLYQNIDASQLEALPASYAPAPRDVFQPINAACGRAYLRLPPAVTNIESLTSYRRLVCPKHRKDTLSPTTQKGNN